MSTVDAASPVQKYTLTKRKPSGQHEDEAVSQDLAGLHKVLVPYGLQPDLQRTCEIVLRTGWPAIKWQRGFTGLHLAAKQGAEVAVRLLLHATAAPALAEEDCRQLKPIDHARKKGFHEMLELLDPIHATDLASGAVLYVEQGQQPSEISDISEADKQKLRDVHVKQCKELQKVAYEQARGEFQAKIKELQAAVLVQSEEKKQALEELETCKKKSEAAPSAGYATEQKRIADLEATIRQEREDHQKRFQNLNRTVSDYIREVQQEKEKNRKAEEDNLKLGAQLDELKAALAARDREVGISKGPWGNLQSLSSAGTQVVTQDQHSCKIVEEPQTEYRERSESTATIREQRYSVDLTHSLVDPTEGIRTQLPSLCVVPQDLNQTPEQLQTRFSAQFWEDVLQTTRDRCLTIDSVVADASSNASSPINRPRTETSATARRRSFDCEEGEELPDCPVEMCGTPVASRKNTQVDLTQSGVVDWESS